MCLNHPSVAHPPHVTHHDLCQSLTDRRHGCLLDAPAFRTVRLSFLLGEKLLRIEYRASYMLGETQDQPGRKRQNLNREFASILFATEVDGGVGGGGSSLGMRKQSKGRKSEERHDIRPLQL